MLWNSILAWCFSMAVLSAQSTKIASGLPIIPALPGLITIGEVMEGAGVGFLGRILADGVAVLQAGLSTITYKVEDITAPVIAAIASGSLTVSAVIFNTIQTDSEWVQDTTGYNFKHAMP